MAYLDKGFIQFAGFTAGRVQSFFDFYADNYNYEGIANSDESNKSSLTPIRRLVVSRRRSLLEDASARKDGIGNIYRRHARRRQRTRAMVLKRFPDVVGSAERIAGLGSGAVVGCLPSGQYRCWSLGTRGGFRTHKDDDGFAVQGGVQFKLPMLAAGDDLWIQGAYQEGAYLYQDSDGNMNQGFYNPIIGGFSRQDHDAYAIQNGNGTYSLALSRGYSVMAAINHYFTPNFHDVLYGSYEHSDYGNRAAAISWTQGGIAGAEQFKVGNQFLWDPVKNLEIGIDVMYSRIDQKIPGEYTALNGVPAVALPVGVTKDPDSFMARLRVERDF